MARNAAAARQQGAAGRGTTKRPLDMVHLGRQTLGDAGLQSEVLRMFDDMSHVYYGRLEQSKTRNDLLLNLHALKGAAMGIGAFGLAQVALAAEAELKSGAPVRPECVDDIGIAVEEVSAFIGTLLADEKLAMDAE